ncbi:MAG: macro domain-containing protein [Burkholderiales bacterium]|nr:macro domain-containing protein [Anaerolineae bacterium]
MKLILVDLNDGVCDAWREYFKNLPDVEIVNNYFESLPEFDCMVSAANSFGLMDGGVDAAIIRFFGNELMFKIQRRIIDEYFGEQPVGTSMIVETDAKKHPFVAHTPTMRVPMAIAHTDNVYLAMWAMLLEVHRHNQINERKINIIACPGLGTLTGHVPYQEAARQMALAYENYLNPPRRINWGFAAERQSRVRFGGDDGFDFPST